MDPICHTLLGATMSLAGLRRRSRIATPLLVLAANAPDIDIVAAFVGRNLEWRRGLTHGIPALLIWPFLLAGLAAWWERRRGEAPVFWPLVLIAAIGVWSHPFFDYLNTYGLRWLMPVVDRWYYADTLFIVDPWLYLMLGTGTVLGLRAWKRGSGTPERPAALALAGVAIYVGLMMAGTQWGRLVVARASGVAASAPGLMVAPVPVDPGSRSYVVDAGDHYRVGRVNLVTGRLAEGESVPKGTDLDQALARARRSRDGAAFAHWSRFPAVAPHAAQEQGLRVYDLRYADGRAPSWAAFDLSPDSLPGSR